MALSCLPPLAPSLVSHGSTSLASQSTSHSHYYHSLLKIVKEKALASNHICASSWILLLGSLEALLRTLSLLTKILKTYLQTNGNQCFGAGGTGLFVSNFDASSFLSARDGAVRTACILGTHGQYTHFGGN